MKIYLIIMLGNPWLQLPMDNMDACKKALSEMHYVTRVKSMCVSEGGEVVRGK